MPPNTVKILTLNVRGLNNPNKRRAVLSILGNTGADICLLQETHLLPRYCYRLKSRHFPTQFLSSNSTKTAGVAILVPRSFGGRVDHKVADIKERLLSYQFTIGGHSLDIGSLYAPNEGQETFLHEALTEATATTARMLLLGVDLYLVFDNNLDRSAQRSGQVGALSSAGRARLAELGLLDIWRELHPQDREYTFCSSSHKAYARLDYMLGSLELRHITSAVDILVSSLCDHAPVMITLTFPPAQQPARHWRLQDSLLYRPETVTQLQHVLDDYLLHNDNPDTSLSMRWEAL